jgi:large subunit ribosomal protein L1
LIVSKTEIKKALLKALENSVILKDGKPDKVRKFDETLDLIINVRDVDIKNPNNRIDNEISLPHAIKGNLKKEDVCFIVKDEMETYLKDNGYNLLTPDNLEELFKKPNKEKKKVAKQYKYFVARGDLMKDVAKVLARFLGQQGKMPKPQPKGFGVIRPNEDLDSYIPKMSHVVKLAMKKQMMVQTKFGKKSQNVDELMENIDSIVSFVEGKLPNGENNIKSMFIKTTMGKPVEVIDKKKGGK